MCDYINCYASSEAYATIIAAVIGLIGGLLALGGAVWVAGRQSKILENQTRAQTTAADRAHKMEELRFQADQFDSRLAVYKSVREWLYLVMDRYIHEIMPTDEQEWIEKERELRRGFFDSITMADFLFPDEVGKYLRTLYQKTFALIRRKTRLEDLNKQLELTEREQKRAVELDKIVDDLTEEIITLDNNFVDVFKPYLRLTLDGYATPEVDQASKPKV